MGQHDLTLVMPVYNEAECIEGVVRSWHQMLSGLNINFQMMVLNDGSRDKTSEVLESMKNLPGLIAVNKPNSGHGPTILEGYRCACETSEWVFQCDSDDEMKSEHFPKLWEKRADFDALFGARAGRVQNTGRKLISAVSRGTVKLFFGGSVKDVNTPYRLMRALYLKQCVGQIPQNTFAPNVIISGAFAKAKLRICNLDVPHEGRRTGSVSIVKWRLWKAAGKSFFQTITCRPSIQKASER